MKLILITLAVVAAVAAYPEPATPEEVSIVRSDYEQKPEGGYAYFVETSDGTKQQQTGELKETVNEENKPVVVVAVRGTYSYINPDGKEETITYYADENGYTAEGPSIPQLAQ